MTKGFFKKISLSLAMLLAVVSINAPLPVHAQLFEDAKNQVCDGLSAGGATSGCDANAASDVSGILRTALNIISLAVGIIAVIMVIVAGLKYITSQGDSNSINSAKNTLLYAVIGLVIVLLSQVIVQFVLARTTPTSCPAGQVRQAGGTCAAP